MEYKKAPEVTRQRLYLDTVQEVMANSSKVLVDVEGGNNMLYLPLDKLIQQQTGAAASSGGTIDRSRVQSLIEEMVREELRAQSSGRRGGAR